MFEVFTTAHQLLGYLVALVVLAFAVVGFAERRATAYEARMFVIPAIAIDVQVLGGLAIYTIGGYWDHPSWLVRILHPLLAISALVVTHVMIARARRADAVLAARRTASIGLLLALMLIAGAIAAVSAGVRGAG
ncbi:hypothetical protein [Egicoccus sp. AB-alg6-2]|uniref:hypothetical protein n=1 Tax=Egicoccus sp. AB-alg6-2 TaxID=3242692 RepID=UPI00359EF06D